jgi:predicted Mrr-cat superfamily restriction endonuclease
MNVWRLITHHDDKDAALSWSRQNGRIAIGWGGVGDIRTRSYRSAEDIAAAIRTTYPNLQNSGSGGRGLWSLFAEMEKGDFVILSASRPREMVVEVEGDYEWDEQSPLDGDYQHQRRVLIRRDLSPEDIWNTAGGAAPGQNVHQTLIRCGRTLTGDDL